MELIVRVPGSCGEVMQGFWQGRPFLVTCPIDRYSTVVVCPGTGRLVGGGAKARRALALGQAYCRCDSLAHDFFLTSELPPGKGMASSSADICAVLAAVAAVNQVHLSEGDIGRFHRADRRRFLSGPGSDTAGNGGAPPCLSARTTLSYCHFRCRWDRRYRRFPSGPARPCPA